MATTEKAPERRPVVRVWLIAVVLFLAAVFAWSTWPERPESSPYELSRADGKSRFYATTYPKQYPPANMTLRQRLIWDWLQYRRRHHKPNAVAYRFPSSRVQPCSIQGLLTQCMEVSGKQYLMAVEIGGGTIEFGTTNTLNGAQWVAAFEHALETSGPVFCYDYGKKRNFQDTLVVLRETSGVVKVVPRSKVAEYQKLGLVNK